MATKHLLAAALTGCMAWTASSSPAAADPIYVEVEVAPPEIETYPQTVYEGQPVYYYEGRWYGRRGPRWVYYREEPRPLVVYRETPEYRERARPARARRYYEARPSREREYRERRHDDDRRHGDARRDDGRRGDDGRHHHRRD